MEKKELYWREGKINNYQSYGMNSKSSNYTKLTREKVDNFFKKNYSNEKQT